MRYVKIKDIPDYPNVRISSIMFRVVKKDGLIVPLVIMKDGNIHRRNQEKFMAFKILASQHKNGSDDVIVVDWDDLTKDEKEELGDN